MRLLAGINSFLESFCKVAIFILFVVMVSTTFAQVIFRYVFFNSLSWSEELARYCLVWLTFIGGALGVRKKVHVAVQALAGLFPHKLKRSVACFNYSLLILFSIILIKYGFTLAVFNMKQLSPAMKIPIGLPYAAIPMGGLFMFVFVVEMLLRPNDEGGAV